MGKRGPQPKSNEKKALEGNPGKRRLVDPVAFVDVSIGSLRIPTRLCVDGKDCWRGLMKSFPSWYFTAADKDLLIMYCEQVALKTRFEREMRNKSAFVMRGNGTECLNPRLKAISGASALILKLAEKLQITREKRRGLARAASEPPAHLKKYGLIRELVGDETEVDVGDLMAPAVFEY